MRVSNGVVVCVAMVVVVLSAASSSQAQHFTWSNMQPLSAFDTQKLSLTTDSGTFQAGANATMVLSGPVKRDITGGHVEMHIWEYEVASPVMHTNFNYFYCHKYPPVCDPCKPEALVYDNCNSPTHFTLTLNYIMPPAQTTGNYSVSLLSGHYYPKEVVVTVDYMYGQ